MAQALEKVEAEAAFLKLAEEAGVAAKKAVIDGNTANVKAQEEKEASTNLEEAKTALEKAEEDEILKKKEVDDAKKLVTETKTALATAEAALIPATSNFEEAASARTTAFEESAAAAQKLAQLLEDWEKRVEDLNIAQEAIDNTEDVEKLKADITVF